MQSQQPILWGADNRAVLINPGVYLSSPLCGAAASTALLDALLGGLDSLKESEQAEVLEGLARLLPRESSRGPHRETLEELAGLLVSGGLSLGADDIAYLQGLRPILDEALQSAPVVPPAVRLFLPREPLFEQPGPLAVALWGAPTAEEARTLFNRWFYPQHPVARLADLGAGYGDFSVDLARRHPEATVWSVDSEMIPRLSLPGAGSNILNLGGFSFDVFVETVLRGPAEPLLFDRVYVILPNLVSIGGFADTAMRVVSDRGEIHILTEGLHAAVGAQVFFEKNNFEVRRITVPLDVMPQTACMRGVREEVLYWVVARRRNPTHFVPPRPDPTAVPPSPDELVVRGVGIEGRQDHRWSASLERLFGFPISPNDLLWAFSMKGTDYHLTRLSVTEGDHGEIVFWGNLATAVGRPAGEFTRVIPKPPKLGDPWIASGVGFDVWGTGERNAPRKGGAGVARLNHQRFLTFLADLGVDRFDLVATKDGSYVWAHLGFDFAGLRDREELKREFREWLRDRRITLSSQKEEDLRSLVHAWELAGFAEETGRPLGREFLLWRGWHVPLGWNAVFHLRPDSECWERLVTSTGSRTA